MVYRGINYIKGACVYVPLYCLYSRIIPQIVHCRGPQDKHPRKFGVHHPHTQLSAHSALKLQCSMSRISRLHRIAAYLPNKHMFSAALGAVLPRWRLAPLPRSLHPTTRFLNSALLVRSADSSVLPHSAGLYLMVPPLHRSRTAQCSPEWCRLFGALAQRSAILDVADSLVLLPNAAPSSWFDSACAEL